MSYKRFFASLGLLLLIVFSAMPTLHAQQTQGGSGLSISPTRYELTINPGKADSIEVTLKNISGVDILARAVVNDFESNNETGEPKIITDISNKSPNSIRDFLFDVTDIALKKDETKKFTIPVQVPAGATSGAYYGVIRYTAEQTSPQEAGDRQVALNASLGLIVLIQVPGNITEQVQAQKIAALRNDRGSTFFVAPPNQSAVTLKNTGNGFAKPFGHVTVTKGGKEVYSYEMNNTDPRSNILPGATRTFKDEIKNVGSLGRYTITANISYGKGGDILTLKTSFWVFPMWFVITVFAAFVVLLIGGFILYRRMAKKRRHRR